MVYLDAAYSYAYYDRSRGDLNIDLQELLKKLDQLQPGRTQDRRKLAQELLQGTRSTFEKDLQRISQSALPPPTPAQPASTADDRASYTAWRAWPERTNGFSMPEGELRQIHETTAEGHVGPVPSDPAIQQAILAGQQRYTDLRVPALAIFALPHSPGLFAQSDPTLASYEAWDIATTGAQVKAFESGVASARVIRLPRANHMVFLSNEGDVVREMRTFLAGLS